MKKMIIVLIMVISTISTFAKWQNPAKPNPPRLVNDYIHLLTQDEAQSLENKLVAFSNKTSIQIAVVILDDLGNYEASDVAFKIGQGWGVGQDGLDNGIVFLIAKYNQSALEKLFSEKRGDWFIATGYGLEPYITDAESKQIGESEFIPFAKEDKYYQGIDATVNGMMSKLGEIAWQQRKEFEAIRKAKEAENLKKVGNFLLNFLLVGLAIGLLIWLFVSTKKSMDKKAEIKRRKDSLKKTFDDAKAEYEKLLARIPSNTSSYPTWASELHDKIINNIERASKVPADNVINEFPKIIESNIVRASQILSILTGCVYGLGKSITELENIPSEIEMYRDGATTKVKTAKNLLAKFKASVEAKKKENYFMQTYSGIVEEFETNISSLDTMSKTANQEKDVYQNAEKLIGQIESSKQLLEDHLAKRTETTQLLSGLEIEITSIDEVKNASKKVLDELKTTSPKENWNDIEVNFLRIDSILIQAQNEKEMSKRFNNMDTQDFASALSHAKKAQEMVNLIFSYCLAVKDRNVAILEAKNNYKSLLNTTEKALLSAKTKCSDSDVESEAKRKLANAQNKLKESKEKASEDIVDWLLISALLTTTRSLAEQSYSQANNDIEEAERIRRRKKEEEEERQRRQREDDNERQRRNSYSTISSPTFSSGNSDSGGGFGGFGGGSFGGGGAGGSW